MALIKSKIWSLKVAKYVCVQVITCKSGRGMAVKFQLAISQKQFEILSSNLGNLYFGPKEIFGDFFIKI